MIKYTQKELAKILDNKASGTYPATSKQCWFLAGLILKDCGDTRDIDEEVNGWDELNSVNTNAYFDKRAASSIISKYL